MKRFALLSVILSILMAGAAYAGSGNQFFQLFLSQAAIALSESLVSNLAPTPQMHWVRNYDNSPFLLQLDSNRCWRWASAVSNGGRKSNNFGKRLLQDVNEKAKENNAFGYCMEQQGYYLVPINQPPQPPQELPASNIPVRDAVPQVQRPPPIQNQIQNPANKETPQVLSQPATQVYPTHPINKEKLHKLQALDCSLGLGEISTEEFAAKRERIIAEYREKGE
ncbi:MAG: hypothetical protein ACLP3B_06290 [Syntrophobacteraceae bacterium]